MATKQQTGTFWTYDQNNTGGNFVHDAEKGIGYKVCIEAPTKDAANTKAEEVGIYFNGCNEGIDCSCCGDRWYSSPDGPFATPSAYSDGDSLKGGWGIPSYIHYADGRVEEVGEVEK